MTDYNWMKLSHRLATHEDVMGWDYVDSYDYPGEGYYYGDDGVTHDRSNWKPYEDLNQAWMMMEKVEEPITGWRFPFRTDEERKVIVEIGDETDPDMSGYAEHNEPGKAICLAVARSVGIDLSQYEEEDDG